MTEAIGKIGSKGELYPPKKIREYLGFSPETRIEFIITPNGDLLVKKIPLLKDILKEKIVAKVTIEEFKKTSKEEQERAS